MMVRVMGRVRGCSLLTTIHCRHLFMRISWADSFSFSIGGLHDGGATRLLVAEKRIQLGAFEKHQAAAQVNGLWTVWRAHVAVKSPAAHVEPCGSSRWADKFFFHRCLWSFTAHQRPNPMPGPPGTVNSASALHKT